MEMLTITPLARVERRPAAAPAPCPRLLLPPPPRWPCWAPGGPEKDSIGRWGRATRGAGRGRCGGLGVLYPLESPLGGVAWRGVAWRGVAGRGAAGPAIRERRRAENRDGTAPRARARPSLPLSLCVVCPGAVGQPGQPRPALGPGQASWRAGASPGGARCWEGEAGARRAARKEIDFALWWVLASNPPLQQHPRVVHGHAGGEGGGEAASDLLGRAMAEERPPAAC
eukprot:scaffold655_cov379-Prasinococcus_capsulatus_cf.AAC.18